MASISLIVENIVKKKPFIEEALARGIVNNAALAEEMIPLVEKELGRDIKFSAVNMAIRRLSEKLEKKFSTDIKFDKNCDILIRSDLVEITTYKLQDSVKKLQELYSLIDIKEGDFLTITQGLNEFMIITNNRHKQKVEKIFGKNGIKKILNKLSSATIHIPKTAFNTIGLFYLVSRSLTWENINIIDLVSTFTEMTIIVEEKDTSRVFDVLKKLLNDNS